ncbi:MAG: hypothetical protein ACLPWF_02645 [Bryobacteraceae bacterium]
MGKLAIAFALWAGGSFGATPDEAAIQNTFVKPWIEALRSKDKAGLERLFHPAVRACINSSTQEFFDIGIERLMDPVRSGPYRITKLAPMTGPFPALLPEDGFHTPVQPTYDLNLQFDQSDEVMVIFLAQLNGGWYEVFPCPNEKGMAYFRQTLVDYAEAQKKAAQIAASLKDPLRNELNDLLRQEQYTQVIQKIRDATGADTGTAIRVMDLLKKKK